MAQGRRGRIRSGVSSRERSRHPRPRSRRPRLAFSGALDLRLERTVERHIEQRFTIASGRADRERLAELPPSTWLGPTRPFAALVLYCRRGDFERGLVDLDSAAMAWRLTIRGWQRLPRIPGRGRPWWSGILAFALAPDRGRLLIVESWKPAEARATLFTALWHESWLELLPLPTAHLA